MNTKNSFILYHDFYQLLALLSVASKARFVDIIFQYEIDKTIPNIDDPHLQSVWNFIKPKLDCNAQKYNEKRSKRIEAGKKGGLAKASNAKKFVANLAVTVTDTVNKESIDISNKPKIEEIDKYCKERNNGIDADQFFNYYEARGWEIKKTKIKNWKACVRTWERKNTMEKSDGKETIPYA